MFCAICTSESSGALREMDGRMVFVCDACENEHPRTGRYNFGGDASKDERVTPIGSVYGGPGNTSSMTRNKPR